MKFKIGYLICLLLVSSLLAPAFAIGAEKASPEFPALGDLPAACRAAKADFRPLTQKDVGAAKSQLVQALGQLNRRLRGAGANGAAWRKYLQWPKLQAELNKAQPDPKVLLDFYKLYAADHEGLELVWFLDVRDALWLYRFTATMKGDPQFKQGFEAILEGLAGNLEKYAKNPTSENALAVGSALGPLKDAKQAPALVKAIQHHLVKPNLMLQVSSNVISAAMDEEVVDTLRINEVILGAKICGTGHTIGHTEANLVPDQRFAVIDILFFGTTKSKNVASKGPARIHSDGITRIGACKRVWVDRVGLHSLPTVSNAVMETKFTSIQTVRGGRIMQNIVQKKAYEKKGQAQQVASQRASMRANQRIDARAAGMLAEANDNFLGKFRQPMIDRRVFPQKLNFTTAEETLNVVAVEAGPWQLAAPDAPPELVANPDFGLRVHQSAINNLAATALGGRTLRKEALETALIEVFGKLPDRLKDDKDQEPWAIAFARQRPISVDFVDDGVTVTLRGRRYYKGDESYPGMNVTASYKFAKTDKGFKAVRQGDLAIFPPGFKQGKDQLSARQTVIRTILLRRFGKIFEPEMVVENIKPEGRLEGLGEVKPIQLAGKDGWLTTAWRQVAVK